MNEQAQQLLLLLEQACEQAQAVDKTIRASAEAFLIHFRTQPSLALTQYALRMCLFHSYYELINVFY